MSDCGLLLEVLPGRHRSSTPIFPQSAYIVTTGDQKGTATLAIAGVNEAIAQSKVQRDMPVEWRRTDGFTPYPDAVEFMENRAAEIRAGSAPELIWLLEHDPIYTGGTSAKPDDLLAAEKFPVFKSSRGGQYTYHGPGQQVAYVLLDLEHRGKDIRAFVYALEEWIIQSLAVFDLQGERREGRVGVWIDRSSKNGGFREDKIAAIGVRVRKWVSYHGISLNVMPDLSHFSGITACGINETGLGITSLKDLGVTTSMSDANAALRSTFETVFGPTFDVDP